jgi:hypothetical protein
MILPKNNWPIPTSLTLPCSWSNALQSFSYPKTPTIKVRELQLHERHKIPKKRPRLPSNDTENIQSQEG